ncbi:hypothetical protein LSAT2_011191 [Lamellibrachia satsuma]|nr:hypothetical protein LSAT2_011191 [Lamellibrachia satsuma]
MARTSRRYLYESKPKTATQSSANPWSSARIIPAALRQNDERQGERSGVHWRETGPVDEGIDERSALRGFACGMLFKRLINYLRQQFRRANALRKANGIMSAVNNL